MLTLPQTGYPTPQVVSSFTRDLTNQAFVAQQSAGSAAWAANRAFFIPFLVDVPRTYSKAWWVNGAAVAGNVDVGIYTISGTTATRIVASTAEAQVGVSVLQVAASFATTTLQPGLYYLAFSGSSATAAFWRLSLNVQIGRSIGAFYALTAHPLANPQTVVTNNTNVFPLFGISELSTI